MATERIKCDLLIIGAGAIGFSIGIAYLEANPGKKVVIADKEKQVTLWRKGLTNGNLQFVTKGVVIKIQLK
jgi:cation diffusion facilitator CzcD-associated flavoprotein CzcO